MRNILLLLFIIFPLINFALIINIPADQPTIQAGINVAVDGDTVLVHPGTYVENINYSGKNITVASLFLTTQDTIYISQTIIDGNQNGSVVTFESSENPTTLLSGFTITNGNSNDGGGIYCFGSTNPTLKNLVISGNYGFNGGGIRMYYGPNLNISDVVICNNSAYSGGGIFSYYYTSLNLTNVSINNNTATHGGGIKCGNNCDLTVINTDIMENTSQNGSGLMLSTYTNTVLENVRIFNNSASQCGGGIWISFCDLNANNIKIDNNYAKQFGGGINCTNSNIIFEDTWITRNYAECGGGINSHNSQLSFSNYQRSRIYLNHAGYGNDIHTDHYINVIVDTFTVMYPTNFHAYPVNNYSFDINHGLLTQVNYDLYVSPDGDDLNSGASPDSPKKRIWHALAIMQSDPSNPLTIYCAPGIYNPLTNNEIFPLSFISDVTLQGSGQNETIIDGGNNFGCIYMKNVSGVTIDAITIKNGSAYMGAGIYADNSDFELLNSNIRENYASYGGGGLYCNYSNPFLENIIIESNSADNVGGGIYCRYSDPIISNTILSGNISNTSGGGIYCVNESNPILENVEIENNSAEQGGGISCFSSNPLLYNVYISNNSALFGGGISCFQSDPILQNVCISDNSANYGGGVRCWQSDPVLLNVTIANNSSSISGGGIYCYNNSNPILLNCILWNDTPQEIYIESGSVTATYSEIQGGWTGEGNIDEDPLFVGTGEDPYSLMEGSPCIDAGIPDTTGLNLPPWDIIGNLRIWDGDGNGSAIIDMGAYEYGSPPYVKTDENIIAEIPDICLYQNYPNPFNPETTINFQLPENGEVNLSIYNIKGQKIKTIVNEKLEQGLHQIIWDGKNDNNQYVASGVYFYKLKVNNKNIAIKKCLLMK